jgi:hypothetical protein
VVTTGLTSGEDIEILTGLQTSDILITEGYQDLVDGELISY